MYRAQPERRAVQRACSKRWGEANRERRLATLHVWQEANKAKRIADAAERRRANPEWWRERSRRRYALKKSRLVGYITSELLAAKFAYWGDRCWMCGGLATEPDHVKPLSKGGLHCLANIRPACRPCNNNKSGRWPVPVSGRARWQER